MNVEHDQPGTPEELPTEGYIPVESIEFSEIQRGSEFNIAIATSVRPGDKRYPMHIKVVGKTKKGLRVEVEWMGELFSAVMPGTLRGIPDDYHDHYKGSPTFATGLDPNRLEIANQIVANKLQFQTIKDLKTGEYRGPSMTTGPIVEMLFKK